MQSVANPPTGAVTFLFTDMEVERGDYERVWAALQQQVGEDAFRDAWAAGRSLAAAGASADFRNLLHDDFYQTAAGDGSVGGG